MPTRVREAFPQDAPEPLGRGGVVGVDPGRSSGAIAYVWEDEVRKVHGLFWELSSMSDREIWTTVSRLSKLAALAVLEDVHAMPKQGIASAFSFGVSMGELKMALIASEVRLEIASPMKWQGAMGCTVKKSKREKKLSEEAQEHRRAARYQKKKKNQKELASRLFPGLKMTHAGADALLLAEYGRRTYVARH